MNRHKSVINVLSVRHIEKIGGQGKRDRERDREIG